MSCGRGVKCITAASNQSTSLSRYLVSFLAMELRLPAGSHRDQRSRHVLGRGRPPGHRPVEHLRPRRPAREGAGRPAHRSRRRQAHRRGHRRGGPCPAHPVGTRRAALRRGRLQGRGHRDGAGRDDRDDGAVAGPRLLDAVAQRHPKLRLVIVDGTTNGLEPQLANGHLDVAILHLPVSGRDLVDPAPVRGGPDAVRARRAPAGRRGAAARARGPGRPRAPAARCPGPPIRDEIDAVTRPLGITLLPAAEIDGLRLIASLTFEGYGPAILPATAIPRDPARPFPAGADRRAPPAAGRRRPAEPRTAVGPDPRRSSNCCGLGGPS